MTPVVPKQMIDVLHRVGRPAITLAVSGLVALLAHSLGLERQQIISVSIFIVIIMATLLRITTAPKRLLEMMLAGERIDAQEALQLGLLNHVVPRDQLDVKVGEITGNLSRKSPLTLRLGRRAFYTMRDMEYQKALEYLSSMLAINTAAEDVAEGIASFIEKREPDWKGK